jgi:hypothetical protein
VQDVGVVWRRGGIDGKPIKVNVSIPLGDGFSENGTGDCVAYAMVCVEGLLDCFLLLTRQLAAWAHTRFVGGVCWVC